MEREKGRRLRRRERRGEVVTGGTRIGESGERCHRLQSGVKLDIASVGDEPRMLYCTALHCTALHCCVLSGVSYSSIT